DPTEYVGVLHALDCFDVVAVTQEDEARAAMCAVERRRAAGFDASIGADAWLATLGIEVRVEPLNARNRVRTAQLLNKTNQMNLRTRRLTERDLETWAIESGHQLWTYRVRDKFGDAGLTGVASLAIDGDRGELVDFVLSCRVIGRKVEETILAHVAQ